MHYLTEYQTFESKQQLNEAIADHLSAHHYELSETVREVLNTIARYAVKFAGAAHLKAATLAELIGKSEKTIRRAINRLQDLRIVRKVVTTRKVTGGQGANVIQILPAELRDELRFTCNESHVQAEVSRRHDAVEPVVASDEPIENGTEPFNSFKQSNTLNKRTPARSIKPSWIPSAFFDLLDSHIHSVIEIEDYWRSVYAITYRMNLSQDDRASIGVDAFIAMKSKRKKLRKPIAYFTGAVKRLAKQRYVTGLFDAMFDQ